MICDKCGAENPDYAKFCQKCGVVLTNGEKEDLETGADENAEEMSAFERRKRRKQMIIGGSIILTVIIICIVSLIIYNTQKDKQYSRNLESAGKYLEEMDYEKAKTAYLDAIKTDPKKEEPYIQLADLYLKQGKKEEAAKILKEGQEKTNSKKIEQKLAVVQAGGNYYDYLKDKLIPKVGLADLGTFPDDESNKLGLISAWIGDVDKDGTDEMITTVSENYKTTEMRITLYGMKDGNIVVRDELKPEPVIEDSVSYGDSINVPFIKEHKGKSYLVMDSFGASQSYSSGYNGLLVYALGKKIEQKCSVETSWYRGSTAASLNDKTVYSCTDEEYADSSGNASEKKVKQGIEILQDGLSPYGLESKVSVPNGEGIGSNIQISGYNKDDQSESVLSNMERTQTGETSEDETLAMRIRVEDFLHLRETLNGKKALDPMKCLGMTRAEIEKKYGKLYPYGDSGDDGKQTYKTDIINTIQFSFKDESDAATCETLAGELRDFYPFFERATFEEKDMEEKLGTELQALSENAEDDMEGAITSYEGKWKGKQIRIYPDQPYGYISTYDYTTISN